MRLPSKTVMYSESVFVILPKIIKMVEVESKDVIELYKELKKDYDIVLIIEALDCLYALGKIDINKGGKIFYVEGN